MGQQTELLSEDQIRTVRARNRTNDKNICATHDFIDANMSMAQAFENIFGSEIDLHSETALEIWNNAWDISKQKEFQL